MAANLAIRLRRNLLAIGGSEVVVRPDIYLLDVVNRGQLFEGAHIRIVQGLPKPRGFFKSLGGRAGNCCTRGRPGGRDTRLKLDLNSFHCLGEVGPRKRWQILFMMHHASHRHSLGAIANGA